MTNNDLTASNYLAPFKIVLIFIGFGVNLSFQTTKLCLRDLVM